MFKKLITQRTPVRRSPPLHAGSVQAINRCAVLELRCRLVAGEASRGLRGFSLLLLRLQLPVGGPATNLSVQAWETAAVSRPAHPSAFHPRARMRSWAGADLDPRRASLGASPTPPLSPEAHAADATPRTARPRRRP